MTDNRQMRTKEDFATKYDAYLTDMVELIVEGNDYDEICQQATDEIAKNEGIPTLEEDEDAYENEDYRRINDLVNERISEMLSDTDWCDNSDEC